MTVVTQEQVQIPKEWVKALLAKSEVFLEEDNENRKKTGRNDLWFIDLKIWPLEMCYRLEFAWGELVAFAKWNGNGEWDIYHLEYSPEIIATDFIIQNLHQCKDISEDTF